MKALFKVFRGKSLARVATAKGHAKLREQGLPWGFRIIDKIAV